MNGTDASMTMNRQIADRLQEAAWLLRDQGADPFRVRAYLRASATVRAWPVPLDRVLRERGLAGLDELPDVGPSIARAIRELLTRGRLPMLDRLRGVADPLHVLMSVPGVGPHLATRLHDDLGISTLEDLEVAAHDGRLSRVAGIGAKRLAGIRDSLASRLGRVRRQSLDVPARASVAEILDVDREYRARAAAGDLQRIAPRRFNRTGEAWLPILHTRRGRRRYTALFSNTARAHRAGKTHDWVVVYGDDGQHEEQHTVITAALGAFAGQRVVAGRETECTALGARTAA